MLSFLSPSSKNSFKTSSLPITTYSSYFSSLIKQFLYYDEKYNKNFYNIKNITLKFSILLSYNSLFNKEIKEFNKNYDSLSDSPYVLNRCDNLAIDKVSQIPFDINKI